MRCFNLTDIPTAQLEKQGLVGTVLVLRSALIPPGESRDVADDSFSRREATHYVGIGVMAVDTLPPSYAVAKEQARRRSAVPVGPPAPAPAPVRSSRRR